MKRFFKLCLISTLSISLIACNSSDDKDTSSADDNKETISNDGEYQFDTSKFDESKFDDVLYVGEVELSIPITNGQLKEKLGIQMEADEPNKVIQPKNEYYPVYELISPVDGDNSSDDVFPISSQYLFNPTDKDIPVTSDDLVLSIFFYNITRTGGSSDVFIGIDPQPIREEDSYDTWDTSIKSVVDILGQPSKVEGTQKDKEDNSNDLSIIYYEYDDCVLSFQFLDYDDGEESRYINLIYYSRDYYDFYHGY